MAKITNNKAKKDALSSLKQIEKEIISNYKGALDSIRADLLKLDSKEVLTKSDLIKYNRLTNLKNNIFENIKEVNKTSYSRIKKAQEDLFLRSYDNMKEQYNLWFRKDLRLGDINKDFVRQSIEKNLTRFDFKSELNVNTKKFANKISNIVTQGMMQEKGILKIAKDIKNAVNFDAKKAITIARNETMRALEEGHLEATQRLIDRGYKIKKVWMYSYHVKGSRIEHEELDGKEADDDGYFRYTEIATGDQIQMLAPHTSGIASATINCRCDYYEEIIEEKE